MLKKIFIILFLILFISSCFSNDNNKVDSIYNTWNLNQNFSWNIINEEKTFSWTWNILETKVSSWVIDKKVIETNNEKKLNTNNDIKNSNLNNLKINQKPVIKATKKETNEQNVDVLEKDLEKELDSLIDLINENE